MQPRIAHEGLCLWLRCRIVSLRTVHKLCEALNWWWWRWVIKFSPILDGWWEGGSRLLRRRDYGPPFTTSRGYFSLFYPENWTGRTTLYETICVNVTIQAHGSYMCGWVCIQIVVQRISSVALCGACHKPHPSLRLQTNTITAVSQRRSESSYHYAAGLCLSRGFLLNNVFMRSELNPSWSLTK